MDLKISLRTIELLKKMSGRETDIHMISYTPQKMSFPFELQYEQPFPRGTPEEQGISSAYITRFLTALEGRPNTHVHSIMILRRGTVIAEGSFSPYRTELWHVTHSLCKSITGLAVGMAVEEGLLFPEEKLKEIFKEKSNSIFNLWKKSLTIEDLLRMSSGVVFGEAGGVSSNNWIRDFLESGRKFEPGTQFDYNSMNTYMLSAAIQEKSGQCLMDFLQERLWKPLGITKVFWEKSPEGVTKGGWGLFLCPEDMAKVGQLCLQNGCWNGRQLVSAEWIKTSTEKKTADIGTLGRYGYGYQMWLGKRKGAYQFNGMLGQNVIVLPDLEMVLVMTGGSRDIFQDSETMDLVEQYFESEDFQPGAALLSNPAAFQSLQALQRNLSYEKREIPSLRQGGGWQTLPQKRGNGKTRLSPGGKLYGRKEKGLFARLLALAGSRYRLQDTGIGVLPIFSQCIHNNFTHGITELGFELRDGTFTLVLEEGEDHHEIPVGFDKALYGTLCLSKEEFLTGTKGMFFENEDGFLGLKLSVAFVELANVRIIKIYFKGEHITVKWNEVPGYDLIEDGLNSVMHNIAEKPVVSTVVGGYMDIQTMGVRVRSAVEPEILGERIAKQP